MSRVAVQLRREFASYFMTPMGFVILAILLLFTGFFFASYLIQTRWSSFQLLVYPLEFGNWVIAPVISMRLIAEERRSGTLENLLTVAVREWEVVLAKYLGAVLFYITLYLPTLLYLGLLYYYADEPAAANRPEIPHALTAYLGLFLSGAAYISIGLFVSTLTRHQIVAAIVTFLAFVSLGVIGWASQIIGGWLGAIFAYLNFFDHVSAFSRGVISTRDLVYFLSLIVFFLFLSQVSLTLRKAG